MYKKSTSLMFFLSILLMLLSFATLVFFFHVIKNKNQHTSNVISTLADKMAQKANASLLSKKISEVEETKHTIDGYFVNPTEIDSFIGYLEGLGTDTGADVKVTSFETAQATNHILVVSLSAKGTFSNVMRTIVLLENSPYQIHITRTYLNQGGPAMTTDKKGVSKPTGGMTWQADITFSVLISS